MFRPVCQTLWTLTICFSLAAVDSTVWAGASNVSIKAKDGKFQVMTGDDLFCEVDYQNYEKPVIYPIYGPHQTPMTRSYPMQDEVQGEATDHPHHKSMWFGHGDVNGISFWHGEGKIVVEQASIEASKTGHPAIVLKSRLVGPDGKLVAAETMKLVFHADENSRSIDWDVTLHATAGKIKLGDTKEGTAALRVHPKLRIDNGAKALNSEGVKDGDVWGKSAKWVDYYGTINDRLVGVAFLDHPDNLRHPTHWHARTYGLFAANPFGLSRFIGEGHDGSYELGDGGSLRFQYRIIFHENGADEVDVEKLFQAYAETKE